MKKLIIAASLLMLVAVPAGAEKGGKDKKCAHPNEEDVNNELDKRFGEADTNSDSKIAWEEYEAIRRSRRQARFVKLDGDGNGTVSLEEFVLHNVSGEHFAIIDKNDNGSVTFAEFKKAVEHHAREENLDRAHVEGRGGEHRECDKPGCKQCDDGDNADDKKKRRRPGKKARNRAQAKKEKKGEKHVGRLANDIREGFDFIDTNDDGLISKDEFLKYRIQEVGTHFKGMDKNDDDLLSAEEFVSAGAEWHKKHFNAIDLNDDSFLSKEEILKDWRWHLHDKCAHRRHGGGHKGGHDDKPDSDDDDKPDSDDDDKPGDD